MHKLLPYLLLFLSIAYSQNVIAQEKSASTFKTPSDSLFENTQMGWLAFGIGEVGYLGVDIKFTYSWGANALIAKLASASAFDLGGVGPGGSITEYGLHYGRQNFTPGTLVSISGGLSYSQGDYDYDTRHIHTLGLGIEAEFMLKANPFGISISPTLMLMPGYIYGGFFINVSIGRLAKY